MVARQEKREYLVKLKENRRKELKAIVSSVSATMEEKEAARDKLNAMPRNSSRVRLRHRCMYTGRGRGCLRKFGMSRICFREYANAGLIPGVTKASW
jgi:small subunit ribosomal protein S14